MDKKKIVKELKAFRKRMSRDYPISRMIFFGSIARGEPREDSDIDLILVSESFKGMNFFKRAARAYDHWVLDHPVDFLCYTPDEFERRRNMIGLVSQALEEGVVI